MNHKKHNENAITLRLPLEVRVSLKSLAALEGLLPRQMAQKILQDYTKASRSRKIAA